jgi:hypothetical protein
VVALFCCLSPAWSAAGEIPRRHSSWIKLSTADFEAYTTGDEEAGRNLVVRLEQLRAILQPILGWRSAPRDQREKPICVIAFGSRDEFQPYAPISRSIGFFLPGARRDFVVLDGTRADSRAGAHEYVHFLMSESGTLLPVWLNEGLAELYSNLWESRDGERTELGQFIPGRVLALRRDRWIPLADLIAAKADSGIFTDSALVDAAYAESWLLAHMLVLDPRYQNRFPDFLAAVQATGTAEAMGQVYGKPVAEIETDLRAHLEAGQTNIRILGDPPGTVDLRITAEYGADFDGLSAVAEMLGNYRGRVEQSRQMYRQLERDYPQRMP